MTPSGWNACIVTFALALSGCLDPPSSPEAPVEPMPPALDRTIAIELRLATRYSAAIGDVRMGEMEAVAYADVPPNAANATLRATWDAGLGIGDAQHCMLHDGTGRKAGAMLAAAEGTQPLRVGPASLTPGIKAVGVMCWVGGPPSVALDRVTNVRLTFTVPSDARARA